MTLCIHLLRLRPTPAQLKEWNEDKSDPHPIHLLQGWTAFLEELAGASVFDDLQKEDKRKTDSKKDLLRQLYEVASKEEAFVNGEIGRLCRCLMSLSVLIIEADGDATHNWYEDEEDRKPVLTKRPHQDIVDLKVEQDSRQSSESVDCKRVKLCRQDSALERDIQEPSIAQLSNVKTFEAPPSEVSQHVEPSNIHAQPKPSPQNLRRTSPPTGALMLRSHVVDQRVAAPMKRESSTDSPWRQFQQHQGGWVEHPAATHDFEAPSAHFANFQAGPSSPTRFHSHQGYGYPQQQAQIVQVHEVRHVPEPQFHATHHGPMYSLGGMMPVPLSTFVPPEYNAPVPASQPYTSTMTPHQYFMPANPDLPMGDFHPQMQQSYRDQHGLAERHIASMQVHGLPFAQPTNWESQHFTGQCHNPN